MQEFTQARRRFLKEGLAFASLPLAGAALAQAPQTVPPAPGAQTSSARTPDSVATDALKAYGQRSRYVHSERIEFDAGMGHTKPPFGLTSHLETPLQDSIGMMTPTSLHYVASHGDFYVPDIDPEQHRLMIHGMVDRPLLFTMEELMRLPSRSRILYHECNGNFAKPSHKTVQEAAGRTSCAEWTGVPLALLLKQAGVQSGAKWLLAESADDNKGTYCIPLDRAMNDLSMVAYGMNGEPVRPQNGFPLRLMIPGLEAINSVKWLKRLQVTDQFYMTYMNHGRYTSVDTKLVETQYEQGPKSVITFPSGGHTLPAPGHYEISGLAWSGGGSVRRVEISTDNGKTWDDAEMRSSVLPLAHTRFGYSWNWKGGEHVLLSRCTDEKGQVQPTQAEFKKIWKEGESEGYAHPNFIMPWKLGREGNVTNGLA